MGPQSQRLVDPALWDLAVFAGFAATSSRDGERWAVGPEMTDDLGWHIAVAGQYWDMVALVQRSDNGRSLPLQRDDISRNDSCGCNFSHLIQCSFRGRNKDRMERGITSIHINC